MSDEEKVVKLSKKSKKKKVDKEETMGYNFEEIAKKNQETKDREEKERARKNRATLRDYRIKH
jgi:hypothetical protein